jgi:glycosyltransferase involved in cell wall biosynthesis
MPLVSVIIPSFNRAERLLQAIDSVRAQTYPRVEIIVVDDGSTDATAALVRPLEDVTPVEGVTYIAQARAGAGAARNRGLAAARGALIASLDSDDLWEPEFLDRGVAALERSRVDFVFANFVRSPATPSYLDRELESGRLDRLMTQRQGDWSIVDPAQLRRMLVAGCPAPSSSLLLRRSSMPPAWNERLGIAYDWYLTLEMALRGCSAAFTTTPLWTKRVDGTNDFDGRPRAYIARELWMRDFAAFMSDFAPHLSRRERARWRLRRTEWLALLVAHEVRGRLRPSRSRAA